MSAPYEVNVSCTDDETFVLTLELMKSDGTPLEVDEYSFEYVIKGCGLTAPLSQGSGIDVDSDTATLTISPGVDFRFRPGTYDHGFRKTHIESGQVDQVFDGTITVSEGHF